MKLLHKTASLFLASALVLFSFISCGKTAETTENTATGEDIPVTITDEEAVASFIRAYRSGEYDEERLFQYDDLTKYFTLGEYKGLEYPDDAMVREAVPDELVDDYLIRAVLIAQVTDDEYEHLTEGKVQKYDVVTIDYRGVIDGEEVENATASDQELLIGSHTYIEGFESGLIGAAIGEETTLSLSFSPYYDGREVAGKAVTFYVTVKKAKRPTIPEVTVEAINSIFQGSFDTLEAARADLKQSMEAEQKEHALTRVAAYLQREILKNSTVLEYPEKEMAKYRNHFIDYYKQYASAQNMTLEDYCRDSIGLAYEDFLDVAEQYAKDTVAAVLMARCIAQKENLTCSDEQLKAYLEGLYENEGGQYGNMYSFLIDYRSIYGPDYFEEQVLQAMVTELICDHAIKR